MTDDKLRAAVGRLEKILADHGKDWHTYTSPQPDDLRLVLDALAEAREHNRQLEVVIAADQIARGYRGA